MRMHRWHMKGGILNPASMKQALVEGAVRIPGINLYEQGAGKMNLLNSMVQSLSPPLNAADDNFLHTAPCASLIDGTGIWRGLIDSTGERLRYLDMHALLLAQQSLG